MSLTRTRLCLSLSLAVILAIAPTCLMHSSLSSASAAPPAASDFFTPPASNDVPTFTQPSEGKGKMKRLLTQAGGDYPTWQQIKMLPSLDRQQRMRIHKIYQDFQEKAKPMMASLKTARSEGGKGERPAEGMGKLRGLRQEVLALRKQTWEQVRPILTESQLNELELMKRGELVPPAMKSTMQAGD